jgi:hypothetical protein
MFDYPCINVEADHGSSLKFTVLSFLLAMETVMNFTRILIITLVASQRQHLLVQ